MKLGIMAPIAFVIGVAGGTVAMRGPAAPAPEDAKTGAVLSPDSTTHPSATEGQVEQPPVDTNTVKPHPDSQAQAPPPAALPVDPKRTSDGKRLSEILSAMPPADAVLLVTNMSDDELLGVLRFMDMSHAGALLSVLPAARSATLSRRIFQVNNAGKP